MPGSSLILAAVSSTEIIGALGTFDFLLDVEGRFDTEGLLEVEDFG